MNMLPRTQIHQGIRPPKRTPLQFLHLLLDAARNRRVPDIGIDLHLEHPPDDLRLQFEMTLIRTDDRPAPRHLRPDELRLDVLSGGDVGHLLGDDPGLGEVHLRVAGVLPLASLDPLATDFGEAFLGVDAARAGGVVEVDGGLVGVGEVDAAEGDLEDVLGGGVEDLAVFFGGLGEGVVVGDGLDEVELRVEGVEGRFGAEGALDVGFFGDQVAEGDGGRGGVAGGFDGVAEDGEWGERAMVAGGGWGEGHSDGTGEGAEEGEGSEQHDVASGPFNWKKDTMKMPMNSVMFG
mmetsp:Transcript_25884/g.54496  ORF Transcript_25884/g.54496 Transcript_25884/m.54496 type:complete len:292 (-) Transcript_25884:182-1057(-)